MDDRLSLTQIGVLVVYVVGMTAGQILFKLAALRAPSSGAWTARLVVVAENGYFITAIVLYATLSVLWVWILTFTSLSRAYLFVALAFVSTPLAAGFVFAEPISLRLVIGIALTLAGILCIAGYP